MDDSPLSTLPPELRTEIFEYALTQLDPIILSHEQNVLSRAKHWRLDGPNDAAALTFTCKQIHAECGNSVFLLNAFELHGLSLEEFLPVLTAFQKNAKLKLIGAISILPTELDPFRWQHQHLHGRLSLAERLSLAIAKLRWAKQSTRAEALSLKCKIVYLERLASHVLNVELDMADLARSWRLVEWEVMGEVLAHPDHGNLQQIYEGLKKCAKNLRWLGLLPEEA